MQRNRLYKNITAIAFAGVMALGNVALSQAQGGGDTPVVTDSRIKTLVYNENEVFRLAMHYGFQSHIQFDKTEVIQTISVGDSYAWKITPIESRIFIKPLEADAYTNMTVVTDKRTYQFDLVAKAPEDMPEDDLVYMVRFYYPAGNFDQPIQGAGISNAAMSPMPQPYGMAAGPGAAAPMSPMGAPVPPMPAMAGGGSPYNFNYSLSGSNAIAPERVFDDGSRTYFEFPNGNALVPAIANAEGKQEVPLTSTRESGFIIINGVSKKLSLRSGSEVTYVYNEHI